MSQYDSNAENSVSKRKFNSVDLKSGD